MAKSLNAEFAVIANVKCDLCGCAQFATLSEKAEDKAKILKCRNCGLIFVYPQSNNQKLESYYQNESVVSDSDLKRFKKRLSRLNSNIGKAALSEFYGYCNNRGKISIFQKIAAILSLPFFGKNIIPFRGEGKILDIGCGSGLYLSLLKSTGWETYGVEVNKFACDYAAKQGIKVFCGELEKANFSSGFFDVIRLTHVLEHLSSPSVTFTEINRILKPGGIIYLETPNQKSFAAGCFKENWLGPGGHLYAFSSATLGSLLRKTGFFLKKIRYKSSKGIIIDSLQYLWQDWFGGLPPTRLLKNKFFYAHIIKPFCAILNLFRKGDTISAEAIKSTP